MTMQPRSWKILWWSLFVVWATGALLGVNHIRSGLITSHGADLTLPAWMYIMIRSLENPARRSWLRRSFGRTPERAASVLFVGSALTEVSQYYWPAGVFPGVFDPWDIVMYGVGLLFCYVLDRSSLRSTSAVPKGSMFNVEREVS